jgi:hypothetical protein
VPSAHDPPGWLGFEHAPVVASHVPAAWHPSLATHVTGLPPVHAPAWHVSACVHLLPSSQVVPFAATGFEHAPLAGSQAPATWQASWAEHVFGAPPAHAPVWQVSPVVQALPSSQAAPFTLSGHAQVAVLTVET